MILFDNYNLEEDDEDLYYAFDDAMDELSRFIAEYDDWQIEGYVQRWNGNYPHKFKLSQFKNCDDFVNQAAKDCDFVKIEVCNPEMIELTCTHHDGTNKFTLTAC